MGHFDELKVIRLEAKGNSRAMSYIENCGCGCCTVDSIRAILGRYGLMKYCG
jgi:hypothetical protein